jgi:hypothetical protein
MTGDGRGGHRYSIYALKFIYCESHLVCIYLWVGFYGPSIKGGICGDMPKERE